jgi:NADH:ubiquinone oxidoreductase subunit D
VKLDYVLANIPEQAEVLIRTDKQAHIRVQDKQFLDFINYIHQHCEYNILLDVSVYDEDDEISFWLLSLRTHEIIGVVTQRNPRIVNISDLSYYFHNIKSLAFQFNEFTQSDFFKGIENYRKPVESFTPRKSVLVTEVDERIQDIIRINNHFNRFGDIDLSVVSKDDITLELDFQINGKKLHVNEKLKHRPIEEILNQVHKIDGFNAPTIVINLCMALEKFNEIEIPDKAQAIRMIFLEFSKILETIEFISSISYSTQASSLYHSCLIWIQNIERVMAFYSGNIFHLGIFTIGGVQRDVPAGWMNFCYNHLKEIQNEIKDEMKNILADSLWKDRLNIGKTAPRDLVEWGIGSSLLRASGINSDLRKRQSYYFYDEVIFNVPIALEGTVYDRLILAFMECDQSFEIIFQVLDNLPTGKIINDEYNLSNRIDRGESDFGIERYFKDGTSFHSIESFANLIHTTVTVKDHKVTNIKINSDSLSKLNYLKELSREVRIRDLALVYRSLNIKSNLLEI